MMKRLLLLLITLIAIPTVYGMQKKRYRAKDFKASEMNKNRTQAQNEIKNLNRTLTIPELTKLKHQAQETINKIPGSLALQRSLDNNSTKAVRRIIIATRSKNTTGQLNRLAKNMESNETVITQEADIQRFNIPAPANILGLGGASQSTYTQLFPITINIADATQFETLKAELKDFYEHIAKTIEIITNDEIDVLDTDKTKQIAASNKLLIDKINASLKSFKESIQNTFLKPLTNIKDPARKAEIKDLAKTVNEQLIKFVEEALSKGFDPQ